MHCLIILFSRVCGALVQQHLVILFITGAFTVPNTLKTSNTDAVRQCSKSNLTYAGVSNKQKNFKHQTFLLALAACNDQWVMTILGYCSKWCNAGITRPDIARPGNAALDQTCY